MKSAIMMLRNLTPLSRQYQEALRMHLKWRRRASLRSAKDLGCKAINLGLETLDLARIHELALIALVLPNHSTGARDAMVRCAGAFFAEAITPIETTHRTAQENSRRMDRLNQTLRRRGAELIASNGELKQEISRRKSVEASLRKSERHYGQLLGQSRHMQEQLRLLSRQLLSAQEEERKKISRELHDVIAQTLTHINVELGTLKRKAGLSTTGLFRSIARTQRLVEQSVGIVHRFARELRPTVLDDLGLVPALHTFMKGFRSETGIGVSLSAFAGVNEVKGDERTVLYRVAQEALTNVARHAQASRAEVTIRKLDGAVCLSVTDNGKGFPAERVLRAKRKERLGLLGMRERLEMVRGTFRVISTPGQGTTVLARIPLIDHAKRGKKPRRLRPQ